MKLVKSLENKELRVDFEGNTYTFIKDKTVYVTDALMEHLKERYPLAFDFKSRLSSKEVAPKIKGEKTVVRFGDSAGTEDMKITTQGQQAPTFSQGDVVPASGQMDEDGIGWYGPGLEVE